MLDVVAAVALEREVGSPIPDAPGLNDCAAAVPALRTKQTAHQDRTNRTRKGLISDFLLANRDTVRLYPEHPKGPHLGQERALRALGGSPHGTRLEQCGDLLVGVAERRQHLLGVLAQRRARARPARPACATASPARRAAARGRPRPAGRSRPPSRGRAPAPSRAPRRGRAPAPGSSRARRRTCSTRRACARGRSARPPRARPSPGASNCFSIRSSRPTPRHHACQNFGSSAPSVTQPSLQA